MTPLINGCDNDCMIKAKFGDVCYERDDQQNYQLLTEGDLINRDSMPAASVMKLF